MELVKEFAINIPHAGIGTVGSRAAVGKTTFLVILAGEFLKQGKRVLYVSEFGEGKIVRDKFKRLDPSVKSDQLILIDCYLNRSIASLMGSRVFDVVILDVPSIFNDSMLDEAQKLRVTKNINFWVSAQLKLVPTNMDILKFTQMKLVAASNYVLTLERNEIYTFTEKLKSFFGIPKPNTIINLIKHRVIKEKKVKGFMDFKNIKIK